jgi:hypothetical protein
MGTPRLCFKLTANTAKDTRSLNSKNGTVQGLDPIQSIPVHSKYPTKLIHPSLSRLIRLKTIQTRQIQRRRIKAWPLRLPLSFCRSSNPTSFHAPSVVFKIEDLAQRVPYNRPVTIQGWDASGSCSMPEPTYPYLSPSPLWWSDSCSASFCLKH